MPTPHTFKFVRQSVPVPLEALEAIDALSAVTGRSRAHIIADLLLDSAPIARSMASQLAEIKGGNQAFIRRVLALSENVTNATAVTLEKARGARPAHGGGTACGGAPGAVSGTLTPPSSNTGGKVPRKPKKPRGEA